jgi:biopolymer transport protein ExbB/TolQ
MTDQNPPPTSSTSPFPESTPFSSADFQLNWAKQDLEQRCGFSGGRFTNTNKILTSLVGAVFSVGFYLLVIYVLQPDPRLKWISHMFLARGFVPYCVVFFFFWSVAILFFKSRKVNFQRKTLGLAAVPQQPDFFLTPSTARAVLDRIYTLVDDTRNFVLLNRIERALSNLQNIGQVNEVSDILRTQAEYDEEQLTSSYGLLNGFVWAIPVLGFIGTVLGLSQAIAAFGGTLESANDINVIKDSLKSVTGGLANAFETTLIALVAALIIQLLLTFLQQAELEFLDECNDYCHSHVVSKLRLAKDA